MKKSITAELAEIARTVRSSTLRQWLFRVHKLNMTDLQVSDMLALIDGFDRHIHPKGKCTACEDRAALGRFAEHART